MSLWDRLTGNDQRKRAEEERRQLEQARIASLNRASQSSNPVIAQKAQTKMQNNAWQVQAKPQPTLRQNIENAVGTVWLGLGRSGIGTAQGISGMYDLMTPGKGNNRFSQSLDTRAKRFDQLQKDQNRSNFGYKAGQFGGDALTFLAGGGVVKAGAKGTMYGAKAIPGVNNVIKPLSKGLNTVSKPVSQVTRHVPVAIDKVGWSLAQKGPGGRIAAQGLRSGASKSQLLNTGVDFTVGLGQPASKGQDIGWQDVALQGATSLAFGGGLPATAQAAKEVFRAPSRMGIANMPVRAEALNGQDIGALYNWRNAMGTGKTMGDTGQQIYNSGRAAAQKAGIDYRDANQIDDTLRTYRNYQTLKENQIDAIKRANAKLNELPVGMAIKDVSKGKAPQVGKTPTSSSSLTKTSPEISASSPRSYGQGAELQVQPVPKTQIGKINNQESSLNQPYSNGTPTKNTVKLNTSRINPENKAALTEIDQQTTEVIESLSNKDIVRLSKDAGIDTKTNSPDVVKKKIAEQLNVRRDAVRYMNEAEVARKAGDFETAKASMLKAAELGRASRAQGTELAQQLQARRIIANELDTPQQRIFKLLDAAGVNPEAYVNRLKNVDFNNPKQVVDAYRDLVPAKKAEWLDTLRYNSMLSSPLTQAVNVFGNLQNVALVAPIEKTLKGVIDAIGGVFGKERKYAAGEGATYAAHALGSIKQATINFRDALSGTGKYANPDFDDYNIPLATKGVSGGVYKALSFPMRVLDGMDKFFRTMAEAGEESALNLRERKGIKLGGNKQALMEEEAAYRVFQQDLHKPGQGILADASDSFASLVMSGRNSKNPIVSTISKFTVPFVKTINNINKQGMIEYSPLGVINMVGNTDKVTALTRATMGTAVFGISSMLLGSGDMTWAEPRDPDERARFRSEGKQPYAVKVGGKWIGFSKLTPAIAFPMAMTAALDDAMNNKKLDQSNVDAILEAVSKYGNFLSDQSYAKSVGDTLGAIGGDKEAVANMVSNNIQQVVPFRALTGWVARMTDDLERKVDTTKGYFDQQVQSLMQQYPGLRQNTPTRDYQGSPIPANNQGFNAFSPVRVTNDRGVNPIDAEVDATKKPETDPLLNKSQLKEIETTALQRVRTEQAKMIATADYKAMSTEDRRKALANLESDIKAVAKQEYQAKNGVGEFAPGYTGKQTKLTAKQKQLATGGNVDYVYAGLPKNMPQNAKKILTESDGADESWGATKNSDPEVAKTLSSWLPNKVELPAVTNDIAKQWAEYEKKRADGTLGRLESDTKKKEILKNAFNAQLTDDQKKLHSMSKANLENAYDNNLITDEDINKALAVEKQLYDAGLISSEGLAKKLGYDYRDSSGTKKSGGRGGRKGKKLALPNFTNISPSKALVNTRVSSVKFAPVKKPVYKGKKVKRNIA